MRHGVKDALIVGVALTIVNLALWRTNLTQLQWTGWLTSLLAAGAYIEIGRREGRRGGVYAGQLGLLAAVIPAIFAGLPETAASFREQAAVVMIPPPQNVQWLVLGLGVIGSTLFGGLIAYLFGRPTPKVSETPADER